MKKKKVPFSALTKHAVEQEVTKDLNGEWQLDGNTIYRLNEQGTNEFTIGIQSQPRNSVAEHAIGIQVVRAVNCHEELLKALKMAKDYMAGNAYKSDAITVAMTMNKAIAKAEGK